MADYLNFWIHVAVQSTRRQTLRLTEFSKSTGRIKPILNRLDYPHLGPIAEFIKYLVLYFFFVQRERDL